MRGKKRVLSLTVILMIVSILYIIISFYINFYQSPAYAFISSSAFQNEVKDTLGIVDTIHYEDVEIFSIDQEEVVAKIKSSPEAEAIGLALLESITSLYMDITPIPEKGYIVRLPFAKPVEFTKFWPGLNTTTTIHEVFLFFPQDKNGDKKRAPYLMILNKDAHPLFFNFNLDIKPFLSMFNLGEVPWS